MPAGWDVKIHFLFASAPFDKQKNIKSIPGGADALRLRSKLGYLAYHQDLPAKMKTKLGYMQGWKLLRKQRSYTYLVCIGE